VDQGPGRTAETRRRRRHSIRRSERCLRRARPKWQFPRHRTLHLVSYKDWNNGGIHKYEGGNLSRLIEDKYIRHLAIKPDEPSVLLATTNDQPFHDQTNAAGVYLSTDGGQTWNLENNGLPVLRGSFAIFNPHNPSELVFASDGRGFFRGGVGQSAYNGPHTIPGAIECEFYDNGGEGVAFNEVDTAKNGEATFRPADGVDVPNKANASNGKAVGWTNDGEWLE
jgi:hypothetical protein